MKGSNKRNTKSTSQKNYEKGKRQEAREVYELGKTPRKIRRKRNKRHAEANALAASCHCLNRAVIVQSVNCLIVVGQSMIHEKLVIWMLFLRLFSPRSARDQSRLQGKAKAHVKFCCPFLCLLLLFSYLPLIKAGTWEAESLESNEVFKDQGMRICEDG